jgi:hypothetical protein
MNLFPKEEDENDFEYNSINNILNSYPLEILFSPNQERPCEHTEYTEQLPENVQKAIINIFPNQNQEQSDDDAINQNQNDNGNIPEDLGVPTLTKKVGIMGPTIRPNSIRNWCRRTFWCFCINF